MQVKKITKVVVSAILSTGKGILVFQRARDFKELDHGKDLWDLPGGEVEFGEDIFTALNRELSEETGCTMHIETGDVDVITEVLSSGGTQSFRVNILVKCRAELNDIKLSEEHSDHRFINAADELSGLAFLPGVDNYLKKHIEKLLL